MSTLVGKRLAPLVAYFSILLGLVICRSAWLAILLYHLGIILILLKFGVKRILPNFATGWNFPTGVTLSVACAATGLALAYLWPLLKLPNIVLSSKLADFGLQGNVLYVFVIYYVISTPILEELFWRGYLMEDNKYPFIADGLFSGYHVIVLAFFIKIPWVVFSFFALILMAWIWRKTVLEYGGLIVPVTTHMIASLSMMAAVWFLRK
jgi:membrane protease YdiL (CAAX protease family)